MIVESVLNGNLGLQQHDRQRTEASNLDPGTGTRSFSTRASSMAYLARLCCSTSTSPALKNRRKKWIEHAAAKASSTLEARNMAATPTSCSLDLVTERPSTARNRSTIEMVLNRVSCNTRHEDSSRQVSLRD